jgi:hypothetical protein
MSNVAAILRRHLDSVFDRFENTVGRRHPVGEIHVDLAGHAVRIRAAEPHLPCSFAPALSHLPAASPHGASPALDVIAWDEASTGVRFPDFPWSLPELSPGARLVAPPGSRGFRLAGATPGEGIHLFDPDSGRAAWLLPDARHLPTFHHAVPLLTVFKWWAPVVGLRPLHAGCVGSDGHAVLLGGAGGSGKSTTALLCALAGLDYLADDICLARLDDRPTAVSLYNSGKLHRDHLNRFPELASRAVDPEPDAFEKPVVFMHRHFPRRVPLTSRIRAVLAPRVSGARDTIVEPIQPGEALRAIAPTTFVQLSPDDASTFRDLASLVRRVPCFRVHLGTRTEEIPAAIHSLVRSLA